jgi:hypothetical protein
MMRCATALLAAVTATLAAPAGAGDLHATLEGGADNDEVYTFAFLHYVVAGVRVRF